MIRHTIYAGMAFGCAMMAYSAELLSAVSPTDAALGREHDAVSLSPLATLGKLMLALMFVLLVFWLFAKVVKQLQGNNQQVTGILQVRGSVSLGQRERVVLVQVGEQQLVLGVTAQQINHLHTLQTPLQTQSAGSKPVSSDFRSKLASALRRPVMS